MNYAPNDLFPSNTQDYTLSNTSVATDTFVDETDEQIKSFKQKLGLTESPTLEMPQTEDVDIAPSRTTMEGRFIRDYSSTATEKSQRTKLSTKQKVAVASYITGVLVLILAVTLCSVAISGSFATLASLENSYNDISNQLAGIEETISQDNYLQLLEKATSLGYVPINSENSFSYTVLQTRSAQNFPVESNWFDQLCDWLGELFGG